MGCSFRLSTQIFVKSLKGRPLVLSLPNLSFAISIPYSNSNFAPSLCANIISLIWVVELPFLGKISPLLVLTGRQGKRILSGNSNL